MSQMKFDLTPIAATISDAAAAEHATRDKWVRAGKALAKAGVVSGMLVKSTEKNPNGLWNESVHDQVRGFIVQGVSASKKGMTFQSIVPGSVSETSPKGSNRWTVADLLGLTREQLREIDDDVLKTQRREYMQLIDGPMISRVRQYIDKANGVETTREKKEKVDDKTTESDDPIVKIQGWINNATKMVDVTDVDRFQDAGLTMIALLRKMRKA
jgi:hypothetical protein